MQRTTTTLAIVALLATAACKNQDAAPKATTAPPTIVGAAPTVANAASPGDATVAEFPSTDASAWVNGAAVKLGDLRGDVVLVEGWHRT